MKKLPYKRLQINNRDGGRQGVNIIFDDHIHMDNNSEVCGYLSDSDIFKDYNKY